MNPENNTFWMEVNRRLMKVNKSVALTSLSIGVVIMFFAGYNLSPDPVDEPKRPLSPSVLVTEQVTANVPKTVPNVPDNQQRLPNQHPQPTYSKKNTKPSTPLIVVSTSSVRTTPPQPPLPTLPVKT